jgi:cell division protein FtsI/penicillin-binding protein 2
MDLNTGEVIAAVSYPEYNSNVMTDGSDVSTINEYQNSKAKPFLDR